MKVQCRNCGSEIEVEIIGIAEAAEICSVGIHAMYKAITRPSESPLVAVKIGGPGRPGKWAMLKSEVERYKRERRPVGRPKKEVADD